MKQNDELTQLTVLMSKEGYFENKHWNTAKRTPRN
jgi:hypothetical protein